MAHDDHDLPDPPGNPEFEHYPEAFRELVGARFERGIMRNEIATVDAKIRAGFAWADLRFRDRERDRRARETVKLGDTLNDNAREQLRAKTRRGRR